jgi:hypothetical protein
LRRKEFGSCAPLSGLPGRLPPDPGARFSEKGSFSAPLRRVVQI